MGTAIINNVSAVMAMGIFERFAATLDDGITDAGRSARKSES